MKVKRFKRKGWQITLSSREAQALVMTILEALRFGSCEVEVDESKIKVLIERQTDVVGFYSRYVGTA